MALKVITAGVVILASALPAAGAARIYCAASDPVVKISIESGFAARDGKRLIHFRGIADVLDDKSPAVFQNLKLNSTMLKQVWMDGKELRFQIYTDTREANLLETFELSVVTKASAGEPDHFTGRYQLTVGRAADNKNAPRDVLVSHEAAIFCDVK